MTGFDIESLAEIARAAQAEGRASIEIHVERPRRWRARGKTLRLRGIGQVRVVGKVDATRWAVEVTVDQVLAAVTPPRPERRPRPGGRARQCDNYSPRWFTGRWSDWHRGHGCHLDDGNPRSPEGAAEIERGGGRAA